MNTLPWCSCAQNLFYSLGGLYKFIFVLLAYFLSGWHSEISVCFREVLRLLVLYTGMLLVSNTAVLCIICLHKCSEDGKNNRTEYGRENMEERICLIYPNNFVQKCLLFWCPIGFVLCYLGYHTVSICFFHLYQLLMFRNFTSWLTIIVLKSIW